MDQKPNAVRASAASSHPRVSFRTATRVWARIGLLSFGGPAGQIALMHKELVQERRWISEERFLHALNYCMLLPGPEAQQLAIYIGWLMHRTAGGIVAGTLFVLPGFVTIMALSIVYATFKGSPAIEAVFFGIKAAVLAVVVEAVLRIGARALKTPLLIAIAAAAFIAIFLFAVPFPIIVLGAGALGFLGSRVAPRVFPPPSLARASPGNETVIDGMLERGELRHLRVAPRAALRLLVIGLILWFAPLSLVAVVFGSSSVYVDEGIFFSKAAVVTFGGAYAVLAYVAQRAVDTFGWLQPGEMLDGIGMAETTPGPLIMVVQFVGFMGAFRNPGDLPPIVAGIVGAIITVWVTFVPCFLWILLGGPYIERLRGSHGLHAALSSITAAVVGVILNLAIWFSAHTMFTTVTERRVGPMRLLVPAWETLSVPALTLGTLGMALMLGFKVGIVKTLLTCAVLGAIWKLSVG